MLKDIQFVAAPSTGNREEATAVDRRKERWLRWVFLAGALADGLAVIPLLHPGAARLLWDVNAGGATQEFVAHSAAALMAGWALLLVWASRRPLERRDVAPLTVAVIVGLVVSEIAAAAANVVSINKMIPTWIMQAVLIIAFSGAYLGARAKR